mgnify:CR=1 FL=1
MSCLYISFIFFDPIKETIKRRCLTPRSGYVGLQFSFDLRTTINSNLNEGFQSERRLQSCDLLGIACGCGDSHRLLCIMSGEFDHFARPVLQFFGMVTEGGIGNAGRVIKCLV